MPTLKEKLMAAKAEGDLRIAESRDYSAREEAPLLIEEIVAPVEVVEKVKKPKAEKKPSSKPKKQKNG